MRTIHGGIETVWKNTYQHYSKRNEGKNIEEISSLCTHNPVALHHKYGSLMDLLILFLPATGKIEAKYIRKKRISHQLLILFIVWFN